MKLRHLKHRLHQRVDRTMLGRPERRGARLFIMHYPGDRGYYRSRTRSPTGA